MGAEYTASNVGGSSIWIMMWFFWIVFAVLMIASMWRVYTKAGKPGWACIVPFYNWIVLLEITGRPLWWLAIIIFLPPIGIFLVYLDLARTFGKDPLFGVALFFLPFVFFPILAFGESQYLGPIA